MMLASNSTTTFFADALGNSASMGMRKQSRQRFTKNQSLPKLYKQRAGPLSLCTYMQGCSQPPIGCWVTQGGTSMLAKH